MSLKSWISEEGAQPEAALRCAFYLINAIDPYVSFDSNDFKPYLRGLLERWRTELEDNPKEIEVGRYSKELFVKSIPGAVKSLRKIFGTVLQELNREVDEYKFQFVSGDDAYFPRTRTISINDKPDRRCMTISGPRLSVHDNVVGICTRGEIFTTDVVVMHEILHYYHITLKREDSGDFFTFGKALIANNFNHKYIGVLHSLWTHTEEMKTITGLTVDKGVLYYCKYSENRYLNDKRKRFRCSHSTSYCTKVPIYFVQALLNSNLVVYYLPDEDVDVPYIVQHDDLV